MIVRSSNGDFTIDEKGVPLDMESTRALWIKEDGVVTQFDLDRYKKERGELPSYREFDILDLGHWFRMDTGEEGYERPYR